MKRNKKIMAVVASAAIVSQLLPMGTVIANAQTRTCTVEPNENQQKPYGYDNEIFIYAQNGQDGLKITFDPGNRKIHVEALDGSDNKVFTKEEDSNDCLRLRLLDGNGNEKKEVKFKGNDPMSKVVTSFDGTEFEFGWGLRIDYNYEDKSRVKISGEVGNSARCFKHGIDKWLLDKITFKIYQPRLEKQEDSTRR